MFKEILQIIPKLTADALNAMENSLHSRFARVAKKFGKGLLNVIGGAGIGGGIGLILDKILNPLQAVKDAIDSSLHAADALKDQAEQFGTTPGELAKLQAFGKAKGLSAEEINTLIQKFQFAVAEATADTGKETSVRKFVGNKDTAQAFLTFSENLAKLAKTNPNDAIRVQQEIFGERLTGKSANFLKTDFGAVNKKLSGVDTEQLTKDINKQSDLQGSINEAAAIRDLKDLHDKAQLLTQKAIDTLEIQKDIEKARENNKIAETERLAKVQNTADALIAAIEEKALPALGTIIDKAEALIGVVGKLADSPLARRFGIGGKAD